MGSLHDTARRDAILARLAGLAPESRARWGRMSVTQMLCHLAESMRMGLGELPVKPKGKRVFHSFPLKHLILYAVPFPKNAPTAPELLAFVPGAFAAERERLRDLILKSAATSREGMGPEHPLFGPLSRAEWGVVAAKHLDHHLRQFGA